MTWICGCMSSLPLVARLVVMVTGAPVAAAVLRKPEAVTNYTQCTSHRRRDTDIDMRIIRIAMANKAAWCDDVSLAFNRTNRYLILK